jgi:hypothetical protein
MNRSLDRSRFCFQRSQPATSASLRGARPLFGFNCWKLTINQMIRHVIWNPPYLRPKSKRDNTEPSIDHGSSFCGLVERLSLFRSWRSKKKRKLILMLHCYDCWFNAFIMEQVLAHVIWLFIQCLYYEADTGSCAMFVRSIFVLWVRYWFLYYVFWFNVYIMKQVLLHILCLLAQCVYYEADTGSYTMLVGPMPIL